MKNTRMDYNKKFFEDGGYLLTEQEYAILNEGFTDFFRSIKETSIDKLKRIVNSKYEQLEQIQNNYNRTLKKYNINIDKASNIMENVAKKYKNQIMSASKENNSKKLINITSILSIKMKDELKSQKGIWFNYKYWDPETVLLPLVLSLIISAIKAFLIVLIVVFPPLQLGSVSTLLFEILFIFIVMPVIEESARLFSIKLGAGGKFTVIYNSTDFAVTFATKLLIGGTHGILIYLIAKIFTTALHLGAYHIQNIGDMTDTSDVAYRTSIALSAMRNFIDTMSIYVTKMSDIITPIETIPPDILVT